VSDRVDVSICVTCYMQEKYVTDAFWSAKNQKFSGTFEVLMQHDNCHNGKGRGASEARNEIINIAKGNYIVLLDADDRLPTNYIQALWSSLDPEHNDEFAGCPVQFISGNKLERFGDLNPKAYKLRDFIYGCPIPVSAMFSKEMFRRVEGFDPKVLSQEDRNFWYSILKLGYSYVHTQSTCLLKNNDSFSKVYRQSNIRKEATKLMNEKYGLELNTNEEIV
jgi:glycosyltransferase involved in cell wall biosynthesis